MLSELDLPLSLKVWLATDTYDKSDDPNTISATSLLKPIKSIVLGSRVAPLNEPVDLVRSIPSAMGTAIHTAIEHSWKSGNLYETLRTVGINENVAKRIEINPKEVTEDMIPIYMEIRTNKAIDGVTVTGKFDFVCDGILEDFKSTSTFTWIKQTNVEKYRQQGSIYRWLNPEIIKEDYMYIRYIFTDWSAAKAMQDKSYPQSRLLSQKIPLMSVAETENMIRNIISNIKKNIDLSEADLPQCTSEELWQRESVFKYYKNPEKLTRSTKNFPTMQEAMARFAEDGSVGKVVEVKGEVVFCKYCPGVSECSQAANYIRDGMLTL